MSARPYPHDDEQIPEGKSHFNTNYYRALSSFWPVIGTYRFRRRRPVPMNIICLTDKIRLV